MDVPLQLPASSTNTARFDRFNPCFSGCASATYKPFFLLMCFYPVSILVLVDVPLQQKGKITMHTMRRRFNPCFSGCASATLFCMFRRVDKISVSILVLVDVPLQQRAETRFVNETGGFQSLF